MRVKCRSCGRKFDYEGCGGMCPKCASYYQMDYRPEEDMSDSRFESQKEYHSEVQEEASYLQYNGQQSASSPKENRYMVCVVCIMIALLALPFLSVAMADRVVDRHTGGETTQVNEEEEVIVGQDSIEVTSLGLGEGFPYEAVDNYNYEGKEERILYNIRITGAKRDEELGTQMPEGYEMLAVSYEVTQEGEEADEENPRVYSIYTNTYLLTKSGKYLRPMEGYRMMELLNCERDELERRRIDTEFCYSQGFLYFMVKEGDAAGMRIFCQRFDYENLQVSGITAGYEILGFGGGNDE